MRRRLLLPGGPGPFCMSGYDVSSAHETAGVGHPSPPERRAHHRICWHWCDADDVIIIAERESKRVSLCVWARVCTQMAARISYSRRRNGCFYLCPPEYVFFYSSRDEHFRTQGLHVWLEEVRVIHIYFLLPYKNLTSNVTFISCR
jgi:hypothetical protein